MTRSFPPHRTFEMYGVAARSCGLPLEIVSYTDHESPSYLSLPRLVRILVDPFRARANVGRVADGGSVVVLREFLTWPFLLAAPVYFGLRRKLWLLSVHNLQRAVRRAHERVALRWLRRLGFRLLLPESTAGLELVGGMRSGGEIASIPLGLTEEQMRAPTAPKTGDAIAIVGRVRREKDVAEGLQALAAAMREAGLEGPLLFGSTDPGAARAAAALGFEVFDTSTEEDYRRLLASSRAVFLSYRAEDYELRTSGVILDAAAAHAAVVAPDFPVFREQISRPSRIGVTYRGRSDIARALTAAIALAKSPTTPFERYLAARTPAGLAESLSQLVPLNREVEA